MEEGTELLEAARAGELERVKVLVEQNTNVDEDNALRWAAREGRLDVVRYLVEHGAVVNAKDYLGDTALMRAAEGGHSTVVQFLTEGCKADVNASNKNGYTALIWAARSGQEEVVRYLTGRPGVEVDARDKNGYTALMKACKGENNNVFRSLAAAGADANGSDDFGYTALMIASGCGHLGIVRFLVEQCHVVVNSRNNRGETAVRVANDCGHGDVERYLTRFLLRSPPSYVSAAASPAESSDVLETQTMSIPPSEVEPIDFSTSSDMGPDYHRVKWLEADACVKLLLPDSDHSSLEKEVQLWQGLRHPNVMNFYGVCDSVPQLQLFVCEYSSKGTLIDHVKSDSGERSSVWRNLHEAAVGLAYLHRQGIVHGDLRCSNILIGNDGIAKLHNVELSGLLEKSSDVSAGVNVLVRWQAPEVLRGEKLSLQSDVYSLGMCIVEVVTREMPWEDCASDNAVRDRKLRWVPESTVDENLEPRCPLGDAKNLVWRMCCQDPDKRASLASVVGELERLAVEEGLDPEYDLSFSFNEFGDGKMKEMWMTVQEKMTHCDNVFYYGVFDEIKNVHERLEDFEYLAVPFDQFGALIDGFCTMIAVPREPDLVQKLSVSDETPSSIVAFRQQLRAIWNALGETTDLSLSREAR